MRSRDNISSQMNKEGSYNEFPRDDSEEHI